MKRTLIELGIIGGAWVAVSFLILLLDVAPAPKAAQIIGPSETEIKEQVKNERRAKEYQKATRTVSRVFQANGCSNKYAGLLGRAAVDNGLSPRLLAGLVFVESSCRPSAISGRDSVGLLQINPRVWKYSRKTLQDPEQNVRIGTQILKGYITRYGLVEGLHHYNGYSNEHGHEYVNKVLTISGIKVG